MQYLHASDGIKYLDLVNNVSHVGHCNPHVVEAGQRQMAILNTNSRYVYEELTEYLGRLYSTLPESLAMGFLVNSGSEANELAVRLARSFTGNHDMAVIEGAYHGHTGMLIDLRPYKFRGPGGKGSPEEWVHVLPIPDTYRRPSIDYSAEAREGMKHAGPLAGLLIESMLSCAGQIPLPPHYFSEVASAVRHQGGLLIADEVITGFGRTGQWFASQTMELEPDMMALAKGLTSGYVPMSAVMVGDRVANKLIADGGEVYHGFTYSGHPVAAAVALANLELIEREDMITRVREDTGPYLAEALAPLAEHRIVGEIRTFGVLAAIELVKSKDGPEMFEDTGATGVICRDHAINRGLMMRAVRDAMILSPALTYSRADIDETVRIAAQALDATADQLGL